MKRKKEFKKAIEFIESKKECIYCIPGYFTAYIPSYNCFFIKNNRTRYDSDLADYQEFKKPCLKTDWLKCEFNIVPRVRK